MRFFKKLFQKVINRFRGKQGEKKVKSLIKPSVFCRSKIKLINNLTIIDKNGMSHQIDHVLIRQNGIFCIETKNLQGLILGKENQNNWRQCLHNVEHSFYNPLKQNQTHAIQIKKILNNKYYINSVVVFVQNNAKNLNIFNVINFNDLKSYLKNFNNKQKIYTKQEVKNIYNTLLHSNKKVSNYTHIKNIRKNKRR